MGLFSRFQRNDLDKYREEYAALHESLVTCKNYDSKGQSEKAYQAYRDACEHYDKCWELLWVAIEQLEYDSRDSSSGTALFPVGSN